ncbi:UDP-2,4-diacetamido-2,4,6-trideoxy-beta-L-altropyranose hydrolase [Virgibacillus halodenitrificans]|uniref:UDP-2,4-diacetamido-2,4, 6-trideoxy-beta-L-altropyranose hydrolase n=1 Tax=Virgibacillus halodenitrificans TaxID=1482 RepID=UPI00136F98FB|nr:UDP-2,4-diacetamido-2,4,6-trideoxy-beta-L-altropyranose hydrolase [Virgibacillus halodenitrificans]MYL47138.1 UDP-2,4-diacetamido-2,4,6-trideoxy-beta-L-altropyranose hydrolase [Virgibacillus halodenitrificans]
MRIIILTEAGKDIGLGHISRCGALYDELILRGCEVKFIIYSELENFELLEGKSYQIDNWLTEEFISSHVTSNDVCIIDSYLANQTLLEYISNKTKLCLFIDDAGRLEYPRGIVVNPSLYTKDIYYREKEEITYLLGKDYVILRQQFVEGKRENINKHVKNVLITMGGTDNHQLTSLLLTELVTDEKEIQFHIVLGNGFVGKERIKSIDLPNVKFHQNLQANEMKTLMMNCDLALTAAGQTIYELMATQTPFIPIQTADNQENNIKGLLKNKLITKTIYFKDLSLISDLKSMYFHYKDFSVRKNLVDKYARYVDGKGSKRIISELLQKNCYIRRAKEKDIESIFELSNQDYVRKYSINKEKISWENHKVWFRNILHSNHNLLYVITNGNDFLGQIRFEISGNHATVSISIVNMLVGKGLSGGFLKKAIKLLKKAREDVTIVVAYIHKENIPSRKLFQNAGFIYKAEKNGMQRYEYMYV